MHCFKGSDLTGGLAYAREKVAPKAPSRTSHGALTRSAVTKVNPAEQNPHLIRPNIFDSSPFASMYNNHRELRPLMFYNIIKTHHHGDICQYK